MSLRNFGAPKFHFSLASKFASKICFLSRSEISELRFFFKNARSSEICLSLAPKFRGSESCLLSRSEISGLRNLSSLSLRNFGAPKFVFSLAQKFWSLRVPKYRSSENFLKFFARDASRGIFFSRSENFGAPKFRSSEIRTAEFWKLSGAFPSRGSKLRFLKAKLLSRSRLSGGVASLPGTCF